MRKIRGIIIFIALLLITAAGCGTDNSAENEAGADGYSSVDEESGAAQQALEEYGEYEANLGSETPSLDEIPVSRAFVSKMLALTTLTPDEIEYMPVNISFSDVKESDWHFKYINAAVGLKYMLGGENGFGPQNPLSIYEAQLVLDRLNPNAKTHIKITPETKDLPISYALWKQLYIAAITELAGETSPEARFGLVNTELIVLAVQGNAAELPDWSVVTDKGGYFFRGLDIDALLDKKISVYIKQNEIAFLSEIIDNEPVIENAYVTAGREGYIDVYAGGARRTYRADGRLAATDGQYGIADVKISGKTAEIIELHTEAKKGEIKRVAEKYIELHGGSIDMAEGMQVYRIKNGLPVYCGLSGLIPGTDKAMFYMKGGEACAAVVTETPKPLKARVLITSSDYRMTVHTSVKISSENGFTVSSGGVIKAFKGGETLVLDKENNQELFSGGRIYINPDGDGLLELQSIKRGEASPKYEGIIEISKEGEAFIIVNELDFERYLHYVVSSQVPYTFGESALKAQAVAARSLAYNQFYLNRFAYYGANVDDSTKSQLYNAVPKTEKTVKAVSETKGQFLSYGGEVIKPSFFLVSSGHTANSGETWQKQGRALFPSNTPGYLKAEAQYQSGDYGDLSVEENAARFFKDNSTDAFEKGVSWFRWSVKMEKTDIEASINANIKERYSANPSQVLTRTEAGFARLPAEGIGELLDMEVTKRGEGGNIMELQLTGTNGEYLIKTENCIRLLLRPYQYDMNKQPVVISRADGSKIENYQSMPSAFFVFDIERGQNGEIVSVSFNGGGSGHGVGMSQYGAGIMADAGASYESILKHYFRGCELKTDV